MLVPTRELAVQASEAEFSYDRGTQTKASMKGMLRPGMSGRLCPLLRQISLIGLSSADVSRQATRHFPAEPG